MGMLDIDDIVYNEISDLIDETKSIDSLEELSVIRCVGRGGMSLHERGPPFSLLLVTLALLPWLFLLLMPW